MVSIKVNDLEFIKRAKNGDKYAFDELVKLYAKKLYNFAIKLSGNLEMAKDITQDTFVKAYNSIKKIEDENSFDAWIKRILINTWKNYVRYEKRRKFFSHFSIFESKTEGDRKEFEIQDNNPSPLDNLQKQLENEAAQKALNKLNELNRTIIILRDIEELSYEEIVKILKIPMGTVKSRIVRARQALKQELKKIFGENKYAM